MHIFPQFTRSAPWGEFAWVEAIIFRGNFMMGRQFSWGQFSSWAIILGENCLGTISRGAIIQGTLICEAISLGYNCPKTVKTEYKKMNAQKTDLIFLCHIKMKLKQKSTAGAFHGISRNGIAANFKNKFRNCFWK